jgi:hypothetical protein
MNTPKIAEALNTIAVAFGELAEALIDETQPLGQKVFENRPQAQEPSPFVELPDEVFRPPARNDVRVHEATGSLTKCPSHRISYLMGKYGEYCPARSDDPAWANKKGYCTITPDNAAEWLRITAA